MKSLHFGAGNIGRGFIGQILHEAGYEITFADIQSEVVRALKETGRYDVILADEEETRVPVDRVTALHSVEEADEVVARLAEADLVTTAVGPSVLPVLAPAIAAVLLAGAGELRALRPSAASVCGPATPSTARPWARWKRRTALRVCGP
jgi:mannitol-1-phosphate/altronate dehydrogenase